MVLVWGLRLPKSLALNPEPPKIGKPVAALSDSMWGFLHIGALGDLRIEGEQGIRMANTSQDVVLNRVSNDVQCVAAAGDPGR